MGAMNTPIHLVFSMALALVSACRAANELSFCHSHEDDQSLSLWWCCMLTYLQLKCKWGIVKLYVITSQHVVTFVYFLAATYM